MILAMKAWADVPQCQNIGTRSEGWYDKQGLIAYDWCTNKVVACGSIGTRSEGWYVFSPYLGKLLEWSNCSRTTSFDKPQCRYVGTRSEGWYHMGRLIGYSQCSEENLVCGEIGTRSEGWYAYPQGSGKLLKWEFCSRQRR